MILYMHMRFFVFLLGLAILGIGWPARVCAGENDRILLLQDENFFLQDELRKMKAELFDKDAAIKKIVNEKEAFESKVIALQRLILERNDEIPHEVELAVMPYRSQLASIDKEMKVLALALEEKNARMAGYTKEKESLEARINVLTGEKISLRSSLKKMSDEVQALKAGLDDEIVRERALSDEKVRDALARVSAEQTLVQEKIALAKKPLEEKLAAMEASLQEKTGKLEEQLVLLRASAGQEEKKIQDEASARVKALKEQLDSCRKSAASKK